jgi:hypothetical protein
MKDVIVSTLNELKANNWKTTFSESVLNKICDATGEGFGGNLWKKMCCGHYKEVIDLYFDGDETVMELYNEVDKLSKQNGFEMPEWGTRGT